MSFSIRVKNEIINDKCEKTEMISLLSAYIRNNAVITEDAILINTENLEISKYIFKLFKELYNITPVITVRKSFNFKKSMSYLLRVSTNIEVILSDLSLINKDKLFINIPREYIYEDIDLKKSYLKGVFLATGSINDPKTARYHLEFLIDDYDYSLFICELLDFFYLNSKLIQRTNGFMVYLKEAEKIGDFLRVMDATNCVLYYEDIKAFREHKNLVNRLNNCEQANVDKTISSALSLIEDIDLIEKTISLDAIDDKLKQVCIYRKKYREESLLELSKIISLENNINLTKSGLNHRIRKIKEIAEIIKGRKE